MHSRDRIFVIGDLIIDEDVMCDAVGLSLESPTLKCTHNNTQKALGGSGNVVMNLAELGMQIGYMSICTDSDIQQTISDNNVSYFSLLTDKKTTVKQRYYVSRGDLSYKYMQINYTDDDIISEETQNDACLILGEVLPHYDAVIISDYRCGLLTDKVVKCIIKICNESSIPVIVNTQLSNWGNKKTLSLDKFKGCDLIIANKDESNHINIDCDYITTLGEDGCEYVGKDIRFYVQGIECDVKDTCGAGDAFTAMISTLDWKNKTDHSLFLANMWAGMSTEHIGAKPPSYERYKQCLSELQSI